MTGLLLAAAFALIIGGAILFTNASNGSLDPKRAGPNGIEASGV
jgi:hypothetical protein